MLKSIKGSALRLLVSADISLLGERNPIRAVPGTPPAGRVEGGHVLQLCVRLVECESAHFEIRRGMPNNIEVRGARGVPVRLLQSAIQRHLRNMRAVRSLFVTVDIFLTFSHCFFLLSMWDVLLLCAHKNVLCER